MKNHNQISIYGKTSFLMFFFLFILVVLLNYTSIFIKGTTYQYNAAGIVSIISTILLIIQITTKILTPSVFKIKTSFFGGLLSFFFAYTSIWTIANYITLSSSISNIASLQSLEIIILWLALIFIGYNLNLNSVFLKYTLYFTLIMSVIVTLVFSLQVGTIAIYVRLFFIEDDVAVGYQYLSRALLIIFLFSAALSEKPITRIAVILSGMVLLFSIGSRSEFFAFIIAIMFIYILDLIKSNFQPKKIILLIFLLLLLTSLINIFSHEFINSRFYEIVNISDSGSWDARSDSQENAKKQILNSPILGEYGGNITDYGSRGYAHNILSAWVTYGIIGFLLYLALNLYCLFLSIKYYLLDDSNSYSLWLNVVLSTIMIIMVFFSKAVFWPLPALVWGLLLKYQYENIYSKRL